MQRAIIRGHLGRNAELVTFSGDRQQLGFSVACSERGKDSESVTTWYDILFHNTKMQSYLVRGKEVVVCGRLSVNLYQTKDGAPRTALRIFADTVELCGGRDSGSDNSGSGYKPANPRSESINAPAGNGPMPGGVNQAQSLDGGDDGLPF